MLVKNRQFESTPPVYDARVGVTRCNFADIFGIRKLKS